MIITAGVILWLAVTTYAVLGGADFGAGFWVLASRPGPEGDRPRALIRHAIGPVWEVNHVWLIYALILLWTAFPAAFEAVMTTMFTPLSLAAIGIVLRGAAFAFGGEVTSPRAIRIWTRVYALSSLITPFLLGAVLGGIASGRVEPGNATGQALSAWLNPTSIVVGIFAVITCAYLAAVFLTSDARRARDATLERYFLGRAIAAAAAAGIVAVVAIFVLDHDSPYMREGLTHEGLPLVLASLVLGIATIVSLRRHAHRGTRVLAVATVASVIWAWGVAQYPYVLPVTLTLDQAAGSIHTLQWVVVAFAVAAAAVFPLLALLFVLDQRGRLDERAAGDRPASG